MIRVAIERKEFGARAVLRGVRFDLAPGEIVAIAGASGCGKSTLLRIIAGLDRDFSGTGNCAVTPLRLAMAFQEPRLLPWRTVRDNLALAGADPETAAALLAALGLGDEMDVFADRLSLGMARRVSLARALATAPDLLLLDEPFVSLDAVAAARCRETLLLQWRARPCTVLLVTHDMADAAALADRILVLGGSPATIVHEVAVPPPLRRGGSAATAPVAAALRDYFSVAR